MKNNLQIIIQKVSTLVYISISVAVFSMVSNAAVPKNQNWMIAPTAVIGGVAGNGFTITDIKHLSLNGSGLGERVFIEMGDLKGKPHFGFPAYYHAELEKNPSRLVINFSQTPGSLITEADVQKKFGLSKKISSTRMLLDPVDNTLKLIINFKQNVRTRVFQVKGEKTTSQVVVDIF